MLACTNNNNNKFNKTIKPDSSVITTAISDTIKQKNTQSKKVTINTNSLFTINITDNSFKIFYNNLVNATQTKNFNKVISFFADSLRFSKYECAGEYYQTTTTTRCSIDGILIGVFGHTTNDEICEKLYKDITYYGIGSYNNTMFSKYYPIQNAYSNFNFIDQSIGKKYFDYQLILPYDTIVLYAKPSINSPIIDTIAKNYIIYNNEPGMGEKDATGNYWLAYENGYINYNHVLTGFDYTLILFEQIRGEWKISGFFQPPGC